MTFEQGSPTALQLASNINAMVTQSGGRSDEPQMHGAGLPWNGPNGCCAFMCDGVSANKNAISILKATGQGSWNIGAKFTSILCFSHCFNNAGKEIGFHIVNQLFSGLANLLSLSEKAAIKWKKMTGTIYQFASKVRWFSFFNTLRDLYK